VDGPLYEILNMPLYIWIQQFSLGGLKFCSQCLLFSLMLIVYSFVTAFFLRNLSAYLQIIVVNFIIWWLIGTIL